MLELAATPPSSLQCGFAGREHRCRRGLGLRLEEHPQALFEGPAGDTADSVRWASSACREFAWLLYTCQNNNCYVLHPKTCGCTEAGGGEDLLIIDGNEGEWVVIAHCRNLEERQYDIISPWESIAMATKNRFFFFFWKIGFNTKYHKAREMIFNKPSPLFAYILLVCIIAEVVASVKNVCDPWTLPLNEMKYCYFSFICLLCSHSRNLCGVLDFQPTDLLQLERTLLAFKPLLQV